MEQIYALRRERLRQVMQDDFKNRQVAIAEKLGRQANYISRILSNDRMLAEDLAREFEEALGKPAYWLDGLDTASSAGWPFTVPKAAYDQLREADRAELDKTLTTFVAVTLARYATEKQEPEIPAIPTTEIKPSRSTMDALRRSRTAGQSAVEGRDSHGSGAPTRRRSGKSR